MFSNIHLNNKSKYLQNSNVEFEAPWYTLIKILWSSIDPPWFPKLYSPNIHVLTLLIWTLSTMGSPRNFKKNVFSSPDTTKKIPKKELRHSVAYWACKRGLSKACALSKSHLVIVDLSTGQKIPATYHIYPYPGCFFSDCSVSPLQSFLYFRWSLSDPHQSSYITTDLSPEPL